MRDRGEQVIRVAERRVVKGGGNVVTAAAARGWNGGVAEVGGEIVDVELVNRQEPVQNAEGIGAERGDGPRRSRSGQGWIAVGRIGSGSTRSATSVEGGAHTLETERVPCIEHDARRVGERRRKADAGKGDGGPHCQLTHATPPSAVPTAKP